MSKDIVGITFGSNGNKIHTEFTYGQDGFICECCQRKVYEHTDAPWPSICSDCSGEIYETCPDKNDGCANPDGCGRKNCKGQRHCCIRLAHDVDRKLITKEAFEELLKQRINEEEVNYL